MYGQVSEIIPFGNETSASTVTIPGGSVKVTYHFDGKICANWIFADQVSRLLKHVRVVARHPPHSPSANPVPASPSGSPRVSVYSAVRFYRPMTPLPPWRMEIQTPPRPATRPVSVECGGRQTPTRMSGSVEAGARVIGPRAESRSRETSKEATWRETARLAEDTKTTKCETTGCESTGLEKDLLAVPKPSVEKCKWGCGRKVQPGLTKTMKKYDTCCKRCAVTHGKGGHEKSCGSNSANRRRTTTHVNLSVKAWVQLMQQEGTELDQHVERIFKLGCNGNEFVEPDIVQELLREKLFALLQIQLASPSSHQAPILPEALQLTEPVNFDQLKKLCLAQIRAAEAHWFPPCLTAKTWSMVRENHQSLADVYEVGRKLGEGNFGVTYIATHRVSGEERICKQIKTTGKGAMTTEEIFSEIEHMSCLDHPNIVKMYEYFHEGDTVTQIQDFCRGGELWDRLGGIMPGMKQHKNGALNEKEIKTIMRQILKALAFMHDEECVLHPCYLHKDLKPQNIMFVGEDSMTIQLIDFGLTEVFVKEDEEQKLQSVGGSVPWMAPEVLRKRYREKADVWSAGCVLYNMVALGFPFIGDTMEVVLKQIIKEPPRPISEARKSQVSAACHDLLERMLRKDVDERPSATFCLLHEWFAENPEPSPTASVGVVQALSAYSRCSNLKRALLFLVAYQCSVRASEELRAIFTHFDTRNRGSLDVQDLRSVLLESGMPLLLADSVVHCLDLDGSGLVEWTEFKAAAVCLHVCSEQSFVDAGFAFLDTDNDGLISRADFLQAYKPEAEALEAWQQCLDEEWSNLAGADVLCTHDQFTNFLRAQMDILPAENFVAVHK